MGRGILPLKGLALVACRLIRIGQIVDQLDVLAVALDREVVGTQPDVAQLDALMPCRTVVGILDPEIDGGAVLDLIGDVDVQVIQSAHRTVEVIDLHVAVAVLDRIVGELMSRLREGDLADAVVALRSDREGQAGGTGDALRFGVSGIMIAARRVIGRAVLDVRADDGERDIARLRRITVHTHSAVVLTQDRAVGLLIVGGDLDGLRRSDIDLDVVIARKGGVDLRVGVDIHTHEALSIIARVGHVGYSADRRTREAARGQHAADHIISRVGKLSINRNRCPLDRGYGTLGWVGCDRELVGGVVALARHRYEGKVVDGIRGMDTDIAARLARNAVRLTVLVAVMTAGVGGVDRHIDLLHLGDVDADLAVASGGQVSNGTIRVVASHEIITAGIVDGFRFGRDLGGSVGERRTLAELDVRDNVFRVNCVI